MTTEAMDGKSDIMTLSEIARYLKVSDKTIMRMVRNEEIPAAKVANQWRFLRPVIKDWLVTRMRTATDSDLAQVLMTGEKLVPIPELISRDRIFPDLQRGSKDEILVTLTEPLVKQGLIQDKDGFIRELMKREEMVSTAIGGGVALPHARDPEKARVSETCIVLGICREGTDFDSLDGEPVHVFFLPCTNSDVVHLRLMAKISFMLRQSGFIDSLIEAGGKEEIYSLLNDAHQELSIKV